jgi:hypothetical protein
VSGPNDSCSYPIKECVPSDAICVSKLEAVVALIAKAAKTVSSEMGTSLTCRDVHCMVANHAGITLASYPGLYIGRSPE